MDVQWKRGGRCARQRVDGQCLWVLLCDCAQRELSQLFDENDVLVDIVLPIDVEVFSGGRQGLRWRH